MSKERKITYTECGIRIEHLDESEEYPPEVDDPYMERLQVMVDEAEEYIAAKQKAACETEAREVRERPEAD